MRSAPYSITPILVTSLLTGAVAGGVVGAVLATFGANGWFWGILCGVLPGFVVNPMRKFMRKEMADIVGADVVDYSFGPQTAVLVALIASVLSAYVFLVTAELPLGYISGALIGIVSGSIIAVIMVLRKSIS